MLVVFLILFRLAACMGLVEFDAVADWAFKAKIFFLCTGHEIVGWFSNPRLAYAHMDYPTLVPSLHAATYDSIGHVDEFVTKFWPTWMLLFLLAGAGVVEPGQDRPVPCAAVLSAGRAAAALHAGVCPDGRRHAADDLLHGPGLCRNAPLGWWKRTAPGWAWA